ncbi:MAG TPA: hypothetical protein VIM73_16745 [Polyangiaceae bacterium]
MNKIAKLIFSATFLCAASASANSLPGNAGHSYFPSEATCFYQPSWAGIANNCTGKKSWVVPLQNTLTAAGTITVKATGNGSCVQGQLCLEVTPKCTAYQVRYNGGLVVQKTATLTAIAGLATTIGTFTNVQPTDTLHLACEMPGTNEVGNRGLMSVSW